jgi:acyl-CoA thioester hydrolase
MSRVKLDLPKGFAFSTEIAVRISDINCGGHLGHDSVLSLIHEARVRFLRDIGFAEGDIDGKGLIMADAAIVYKSRGFWGQVLKIEVAISGLGKYACDLVYRLTDKETGKEVARAKTGMAFFDYSNDKLVAVPQVFEAVLAARNLLSS